MITQVRKSLFVSSGELLCVLPADHPLWYQGSSSRSSFRKTESMREIIGTNATMSLNSVCINIYKKKLSRSWNKTLETIDNNITLIHCSVLIDHIWVDLWTAQSQCGAKQHCRLSICSYFGLLWQIQHQQLSWAGLSMWCQLIQCYSLCIVI